MSDYAGGLMPSDLRKYQHRDRRVYQSVWAYSPEGAARWLNQHYGYNVRAGDMVKVSDSPPPAPPA